MLSIFWLFVLVGLGCASYQPPNRPPAITIRYEEGNFVPSVDLEYISKPPVKYTYAIRFSRWEGSSSLYLSEPYSNRAPSTGSWTQLWEKSPALNSAAISGSYGAWPSPASGWNASIAGKDIVRYTGRISLEKLLDAGLVSLEVTATHFVYKGIVFAHYLQPVRESVYSATSYSKPFIVSLDRKTDGIEEMNASPVEASILSSEALGLTGLKVSIETHTPNLGRRSHGKLRLVSVSGKDDHTSVEYEEETSCYLREDGWCKQIWDLTLDRAKEGYYNETYTLNYGLESCLTSSPENCIYTDASVKVGLLISGGSTAVTHISTLAVTRHNITYYYDNLFSQQRLDRGYVTGESVRFRHLSQGEYMLELWNLWVCATVENGLPPSLGARRGCSEPESIEGATNIPAHMQWKLLAEGEYTEAAAKFNFKLEGKDAASMRVEPLAASSSVFYLHLESRAVRTSPGTLAKTGKHEMGAVVLDGIHILTTDTSPVWVWPVVGGALMSMGAGAFYAYRRGKRKSFLTGTMRV